MVDGKPDFEGGLVARGESFELRRGGETFTGEVFWSWEEHDETGAPLNLPRRVYPISVLIDSIRGTKPNGRRMRLTPADRWAVAEALRNLLVAEEPGIEVELFTNRKTDPKP